MRINTFPPLSVALLSAALSMSLVGCQTIQSPSSPSESVSTPEQRVYLRLYDTSHDTANGITLIAKDQRLQQAIRHAFPDTPLKADTGVDMNYRLDVWAENLSPTAFLDHLASQAGVVIAQNGRGEIEIRSTDQWAFSLPASDAESLMPQAVSITREHQLQSFTLGEHNEVLLISGSADALMKARRALEQLSDRVRLERTFQTTPMTR